MGCCAMSKNVAEQRQQGAVAMQQQQMQLAVAMQQQQLATQQQMMRDDPECKQLMDKQMDIQKRILEAASRGDANASIQIQQEYVELMKNPKFMKMMTPDISALKKMTKMNFNTKTNGSQATNTTAFVGGMLPLSGQTETYNGPYNGPYNGQHNVASSVANNGAYSGPYGK